MIIDILITALRIYFYVILVWVILSWIPTSPGHPLSRLSVFLDRLIYPVILPLRRVIPPVRLGRGMLDLSPIILIIGIQILIGILARFG